MTFEAALTQTLTAMEPFWGAELSETDPLAGIANVCAEVASRTIGHPELVDAAKLVVKTCPELFAQMDIGPAPSPSGSTDGHLTLAQIVDAMTAVGIRQISLGLD